MTVKRRSTMEIALSCEIETATGRRYRWHRDAPTENDRPAVAPSFDTQRGTGMAGGRVTLRRRIDRDWPDLTLGDTVRLIGADGSIAYEGWISALPRTTEGGNAITVDLAGFMALAQDEQFTEIYRSGDLSRWSEPSVAYRTNLLTSGYLPVESGSVSAGNPALVQIARFAGLNKPYSGNLYDSGGIPIRKVYYSNEHAGWTPPAAALVAQVIINTTDNPGTGSATATADIEGTNSGTLTATTAGTYAMVEFFWTSAATTADVIYQEAWKRLIIYGDHGLTLRGTEPEAGFYVSDLIRNMASRWAPGLDTSGVEDTRYIVREAAYFSPTYPFDAWQDLNRFHLWDLGVWEGKRLVYAPPSSLDEWDWEVRASDPGTSVSLEGDQFPYNGVLVTFTDLLTGSERTIGPDDYADLFDDSEANPATSHGRRRFFSTSVPFPCQEADAVQVGRARFAEAIRAQARGSISTGPTIRDKAGALHPAWKVRAGDRVVITDLPNDRPRRITSTSWDGRRLTLAVDNISRRMEAIFDARVPAARSVAGLG